MLFNLSRPSQCVWRQGILWSIACLFLIGPSGTQMHLNINWKNAAISLWPKCVKYRCNNGTMPSAGIMLTDYCVRQKYLFQSFSCYPWCSVNLVDQAVNPPKFRQPQFCLQCNIRAYVMKADDIPLQFAIYRYAPGLQSEWNLHLLWN